MANDIPNRESVDLSKKADSTQTSQENGAAGGDSQTHGAGGTETGKHDEGHAADGQTMAPDGTEKDDINPDTGKPFTIEEWRDKFRASASGANQLLNEKKTLEADIARVRADSDKTLKEKDDEIARLRGVAEGKNPDGLSLLDLQKKFGDVSGELSSIKENGILDTFLASTKIAGADSFKETLRALARSNPTVPVQTLWDNNLKVAATAAAVAAKERDTTRKGSESDSGRGTSSREHKGETVGNTGLTLAEFNKLPVSKRRDLLAKG